jgi:hypothetical protein
MKLIVTSKLAKVTINVCKKCERDKNEKLF